jgi:cystathionine beta-lyase
MIVTPSAARADALGALPDEVAFGAGIMGLAANEAAYREGRPWLDDTLRYLEGNRRLAAKLIAERLPRIRWVPPEATYLAWLDCSALGLGDDPATAFLERCRVALSPGPSFGTGGNGFARLNLATSRAILTEAIERMAGAC